MIFGNRSLSSERRSETVVTAWFPQKREDVNHTFAQHFIAAETGDALHGAIPGDDLAIAIKREDTVDARVDQSGKQECGVCIQILVHRLTAYLWITSQS